MIEKRHKRFNSIVEESLMPTIIGTSGLDNYSILIISWGTTFGTVKEAVEKIGRSDISYMHFSQVYPLHPNIASWIKKSRKTVVVELNSTGQFAKLIRRDTGLSVDRILKDDGMPFNVEELIEKIMRMI
jgi:2-oxoglutarate ferredoxin oxidoreductase subunit alpha